MQWLRVTALLCLAAGSPLYADLLYTFSANPTYSTTTDQHQVLFSFTIPHFVKAGDTLPPISFDLTDGSSTWKITRGTVVTMPGTHCFLFGTADYTLPSGAGQNCEIQNAVGNQAAFFFAANQDLPTTIGHTAYAGFVASYAPPDGGQAFDFLTAGLDISGTEAGAVPEPATVSTVAGTLLALTWLRRRRSATK